MIPHHPRSQIAIELSLKISDLVVVQNFRGFNLEEFRRILGFGGTQKPVWSRSRESAISGVHNLHPDLAAPFLIPPRSPRFGGPPKTGVFPKTPKTPFLGARPGI